MNLRRLFHSLLLMFLLSPMPALAEEAASSDAADEDTPSVFAKFTETFDGYLEQATAFRFADDSALTKIRNSLRLKYAHDFGEHVTLTLDALAAYDAVYDVDDDLKVADEEDYRAYIDPREVTLDISAGKFDIKLGRQQIVWEVTDKLMILDVVNPLDLREFTTPDIEDLRIPLWMANVEYFFTPDVSLQTLMIPDMTMTETAHAGSEFAYHIPSPPAGFALVMNEEDDLNVSFKNTVWGARLKGLLRGWDVTLNALYGWDVSPTQKKRIDAAARAITVSPEHERMSMVGGSVVNVLWETVVRLEAAAKFGKYFRVTDATAPDMVVEKDTLDYALAFERDMYRMSWLLQAHQQVILDYDDAISPEERVNSRITLRAAKYIDTEETLQVEITTVYRINDEDYWIAPNVEYKVTDSWRLKGGFDIFGGGDEATTFGQFDKKDRIYAEARYSF